MAINEQPIGKQTTEELVTSYFTWNKSYFDHLAHVSPSINERKNQNITLIHSLARPKEFKWNPQTIENRMDEQCRVSIQIPVHFKERNLFRALECYAKQIWPDWNKLDYRNYEVSLLINGPESENLNEKYFVDMVRKFRSQYPWFRLNLYFCNYNNFNISLARRDLASFSLQRASDSWVDINSLAIVTNDADALWYPSNYVSRIMHQFDQDPNLHIQTGVIEYPREDYFANHLLLAVNRFYQYFESILNHKKNRFTVRWWNTAIRASIYAESWWHDYHRLKRENLPIYQFVRSHYWLDSVKRDPVMRLVTNARRALFALETWCLAKQHANFWKEWDFSSQYLTDIDSLILPERDIKVTNSNFDAMLEDQINSYYSKLASDMWFILKRKEEWTLEFEEAKQRSVQEINLLNQNLKKAAWLLWIEIEFITLPSWEFYVHVSNMDKLRRGIIERYNNI